MNSQIRDIACQAAREAGQALLKDFYSFDRRSIRMKSRHEIVTASDIRSEKIILSLIRKNFPDHEILSEEAGDNFLKSNYLWVVDPLDGTTNFSMHNPLWSVSIGIFHHGEIVGGVIYVPVLDEMFVAKKGKGATLNRKKMKVSNFSTGKVLNAFCHGNGQKDIERAIKYYNQQKKTGFDCRQLGSAAIELAYVATGRIESVTIPGAHPWDVAAGALMVREAGGRVTDFQNKEWGLSSKDILASNGCVHNEVLKIIK